MTEHVHHWEIEKTSKGWRTISVFNQKPVTTVVQRCKTCGYREAQEWLGHWYVSE